MVNGRNGVSLQDISHHINPPAGPSLPSTNCRRHELNANSGDVRIQQTFWDIALSSLETSINGRWDDRWSGATHPVDEQWRNDESYQCFPRHWHPRCASPTSTSPRLMGCYVIQVVHRDKRLTIWDDIPGGARTSILCSSGNGEAEAPEDTDTMSTGDGDPSGASGVILLASGWPGHAVSTTTLFFYPHLRAGRMPRRVYQLPLGTRYYWK